MAFSDLTEGLAEIFGEWDQRGEADQRVFECVQMLARRDKERKQDPWYKARRRAYMREYSKLAHVKDRQREYMREYQKIPEVAEKRRRLYGEKKRLRERARRLDPGVGERIRAADRERYRRKKAAAKTKV